MNGPEHQNPSDHDAHADCAREIHDLQENVRTLKDCVADALRLMNGALRRCAEYGPSVAMEHLESCMAMRDMIEEDMPDDCVTKWKQL